MLDADIDFYSQWAELTSELHARPFSPIKSPKTIIRCCFLVVGPNTDDKDNIALLEWCRNHSVTLPGTDVRHFRASLPSYDLIWERHSEFISLTWQFSGEKGLQVINSDIKSLLSAPYNLVVKTRIELRSSNQKDLSRFSAENLCLSQIGSAEAKVATDFKPDAQGYTNFLIELTSPDPLQAGMLVRRILELDTYRTLSLLGFLKSKKITPHISGIENQTMKLTGKLNQDIDLATTRKTLEEITSLAGSLASISAHSQYRLSASRAYYKLVLGRLKRLQEKSVKGHQTLEGFLALRLAPAMRTCESVESRIDSARSRLSEATQLLRTKIDIEMQAQNKSLLESMNRRADQQYRLQKTVEGLSIAAVSYYVVGLIAYLLKGVNGLSNSRIDALIAVSVPMTLIVVWLMIVRIKKIHDYD